MLRKFSARNFRSIENLTVILEPLSVFVGPNGSGKTSFFRALEVFGEILFTGSVEPLLEDDWETLCYRGAGGTRTTLQLGGRIRVPYRWPESSELGVMHVDVSVGVKHISSEDDVVVQSESITLHRFRGGRKKSASIAIDHDGNLRIDAGDDSALWEALTSGLVFATRSREKLTPETLVNVLVQGWSEGQAARIDNDDPHLLRLTRLVGNAPWFRSQLVPRARVRRFRLETASLRGEWAGSGPPIRGQLGLAGEGLPEVIDRLKREKQLPRVLAPMREVLPRLESVGTARKGYGRKSLVFREKGFNRALPDSAISDGTLHTLALIAALTPERRPVPLRTGRIIVLEELENAVHPWAVGTLLRVAQRASEGARQQVLISTHSPVVVDSTPVESLYVVEHEGPATTITRAQNIRAELKERLARSGMSLGDVWLDGLLGGVPIGSASTSETQN